MMTVHIGWVFVHVHVLVYINIQALSCNLQQSSSAIRVGMNFSRRARISNALHSERTGIKRGKKVHGCTRLSQQRLQRGVGLFVQRFPGLSHLHAAAGPAEWSQPPYAEGITRTQQTNKPGDAPLSALWPERPWPGGTEWSFRARIF